jgi:ABC-type nitrate/sulfonate/bicarbonate transport system permease component
VALVFLIWEVGAFLSGASPLHLPRPGQIVYALVTMLATGALATDLSVTLGRTFAGFALALGTLLGVWIVISAHMRAIADMYIAAHYPLPKVKLFPLRIIWLGIVVATTRDAVDIWPGRWPHYLTFGK